MHAGARQLLPAQSTCTQASTYNKEHFYFAIAATLVSLGLLMFLLRAYTRIKLLHFFAVDDWLMLAAGFCMVGMLVVFDRLLCVPTESPRLWLWTSTLLTILGLCLVKLSIIFFLFRIVQRRIYRRVLYSTTAVVATSVIWSATSLFHCIPVSAAWNDTLITTAHCFSQTALASLVIFFNSINAATDLMFAVIPLSVACSSHHTIRTRSFLVPRIIITSLGLVSTTAAIVRLILLSNMHKTTFITNHKAQVCTWSVVEMSTGMTAGCLPTLKPLFTTVSDFFSNLSPTRSSTPKPTEQQRHDSAAYSPPPSPYPQSYSTPTFLSLPRPKPARFHDHTSDLDFDLFETPTVTRSRTHSRNPSNLTVFTTFTSFTSNFSVPPFDREVEVVQPKAHSTGAGGVDGVTELDLQGVKSGYAVSVTSGYGSGETCDGSEDERTVRRCASEGIMRTTEVTVS